MSVLVPTTCREFPFRKIDQHPGQTSRRKMLLLHNREQADHKDLNPFAYKWLLYIFFPLMMLGPVNCGLVLITLCVLLPFAPLYLTIATGAIVAHRCYAATQARLDVLISRADGLDHIFHNFGNIKDHQHYQDVAMIKRAWATSPYRLNLYHHAYNSNALDKQQYDTFYHDFLDLNTKVTQLYQNYQTNNKNIENNNAITQLITEQLSKITFNPELDMVSDEYKSNMLDNVIYHQPIEGFCFWATIGTVVLSLPSQVKLFATPRLPQPVRLDQVPELLHTRCGLEVSSSSACTNETHSNSNNLKIKKEPITKLDLYHIDNDIIDFQKFTTIMLKANQINTRICVNFLRTPLFNPVSKNKWSRAYGTLAGHWSPVAGCVFNPEDNQFYALILDVNHTYGAWMVPFKRLFESCFSRDEKGFRGLAVFDINEDLVKMYCHHHVGTTNGPSSEESAACAPPS